MSLKSLMNGVAVATIAAGTLLAPADAGAREWRRGGHGEGAGPGSGGGHHEGRNGVYTNRWGDVRGGRHEGGRGSWAHRRDWDEGRQERHGDHTARNVAIGAFAAVLGLALAAESQRVREEYYEERD